MEFNIEVRKKQLQSLDQYITSSRDKVQSILEYLGWNPKKVLEEKPTITCSSNKHHKIPLKSAEGHLKTCLKTTAGYGLQDNFLSEPLHDSTSSIILDKTKKQEIIGQARNVNPKFKPAWNGHDSDPMTADRLFATYSSDERLAIYNYCAKNTESPPVPSEFNISVDNKKEETSVTHEEQLAKERDAKRRRIKYKSVHTSRSKSHTEIMKEVIENQMELYKEYLASKEEVVVFTGTDQNLDTNLPYSTHGNTVKIECKSERIENDDRPHSSISRHSTHSGSSRGPSKKDRYVYKNDFEYSEHNEHKNIQPRDGKHNNAEFYEYSSHEDRRSHNDKHFYNDRSSHNEKSVYREKSSYKSRSSYKEKSAYKETRNEFRHKDEYRRRSRDKHDWLYNSERRH